MNFKKVMAAALSVAMAASMAACGGSGDSTTAAAETTAAEAAGETEAATEAEAAGETEAAAAGSGETINISVWGAEEDQDLLKDLISKFEAAYPEQTFNISLGVESESTAKDTILTDVEAAADVFAFASDQITDLVNAGALAKIDDMDAAIQNYAGKSVADIKAANSEGSIQAATVNDSLYAFPMAGDNGYFLFYDSSVLSEEDVASWDSLLAAADAAGKQVGMTLASGWYNASFFYGAGFSTGLNADGTTSIDFNGTSADGITGVQVVQGMLNIASNPAFMAVADNDLNNQINSGALCAVVDGTWDAQAAQDAWGEGYAATKLPTFTVGDQQVQQGSVAGFKFIGVNAYAENVGWATLLAEFLTNEESQMQRFEEREIGPTNLAVAESDAVKANIAIAALSEQSAYGFVQVVGGKYWDPTATFGEMVAQGSLAADDEAAIQSALDTLVEGVTAPVE